MAAVVAMSQRACSCSRPIARLVPRTGTIQSRITHGPRDAGAVAACAGSPAAQLVTRDELTNAPADATTTPLPPGYHWYETMLVLRASINDQDRDEQLAKFEAYLNREDCLHISALVRNRSRMAYPMKGNWDGMYVLYTYAARRQTARNVQLLLSNPEAGSEDKVLRHLTLCRA